MPGWVYDWDTESPLCQEAPFFRVSPARCHQEAALLGSTTPLEVFLKQLLKLKFRTSCYSNFYSSFSEVAALLRPALGMWPRSIYASSSFRRIPKQNTGCSEKRARTFPARFVLESHDGKAHVAPGLAQGSPGSVLHTLVGLEAPENLHFSLVSR